MEANDYRQRMAAVLEDAQTNARREKKKKERRKSAEKRNKRARQGPEGAAAEPEGATAEAADQVHMVGELGNASAEAATTEQGST